MAIAEQALIYNPPNAPVVITIKATIMILTHFNLDFFFFSPISSPAYSVFIRTLYTLTGCLMFFHCVHQDTHNQNPTYP